VLTQSDLNARKEGYRGEGEAMRHKPETHGDRRMRGRFRFAFSSFQLHLAAIAIFAIAPALMMLSYSIVEWRRNALAELGKDARLHGELIARNVEQLIEGSQQVLRALAEVPAVQEGDSALCARLFTDLAREFDHYDNFGLIGADGMVIASSKPIREPVDLADRSYFRLARERAEFSIGEYQIGRVTASPTINFGFPVSGGERGSVVYAALKLEWLNEYAATAAAGLPPGSALTLIDRGAVILVHVPDPEKRVGTRVADARMCGTTFAGEGGFFEGPGCDGVDRINVVTALRTRPPAVDMCVVIGVLPKAAYADLNRFIGRVSAIFAILALLLGAAIWVSGKYFFRRPLGDLIGAANELSTGTTGARARVLTGVAELRGLGVAFNRMAESLERNESERRKAESEKERLQRQLAKASRMDAIGALTGGIAHDFNNVLLTIKGNVEFAMAKTPEGDPLHEDLVEIHEASERAVRLTRQLLAFGRRQALRYAAVDLNTVVRATAKMLERTLGENIRLSVVTAEALPSIRADQGSIEQIILNLALNARDAMPNGGALTIRTTSADFDLDYCKSHSEAIPGPHVCLSVSDTGSGMEPRVMQKIFEPFFTTKTSAASAGWGLAIVHGIVKQHQGWIDVASAPGQGSTFAVYFPVSEERVEEEQPVRFSLPDLVGRGELILVVEDDRAVRDFVQRALVSNGYAIREAATAQEALRIVERERGLISLVFADVILPDANGLALVEQITADNPGIHVLLSSGYVGETSRWEEILSKGLHFLQKPFSILALLQAIREALEAPARE